MTRVRLDARRLLCPLPVIRVQDRVKSLHKGDRIEILCTDPGALHDIPAWCRIYGHRILETRRDEHGFGIHIEIGGGDG
jgi:tRNA 2-thiouridine synthesizing protein A